MKPELLLKLLTLAIGGAFENLFGLVNCFLSMQKVEHIKDGIYRVVFVVDYQTTKSESKEKKIVLKINLTEETAKLEC